MTVGAGRYDWLAHPRVDAMTTRVNRTPHNQDDVLLPADATHPVVAPRGDHRRWAWRESRRGIHMYPSLIRRWRDVKAHHAGAFQPSPLFPVEPPLLKRMDITGARWGVEGAEAVLKLRALRVNGDFDDYWAFHLSRERARVHEARYLDNVIPLAA